MCPGKRRCRACEGAGGKVRGWEVWAEGRGCVREGAQPELVRLGGAHLLTLPVRSLGVAGP